jgi:RecA-family ATPase
MSDARYQTDICPFFDVFFQYEELVIMFGDTGKGKSIAAVALADSISKGQSFMGLENAYGPLPVLYYDFELSDKQFEKRYTSDQGGAYSFSDNFFIDNVDLATLTPSPKVKNLKT